MLLRAVIAALSLAACLQIANLTFAPARGLQAEYFTGEPGGRPALTGVDVNASTDAIQRRWLASPPINFSVRWYGFLTIAQPGRYTFSVSSDDGALLTLDGSLAIDNGGRHGLQTQATTLDLDRGAHSIVIDFQQAGGPFVMEWRMAPEGQPPGPPPRWSVTPRKTALGSLQAARFVEAARSVVVWFAVALTVLLAWQRRDRIAAYPRVASLALFIALALVHTWPLASDLAHLTRHDNRDAMLNEWIVAWVAHQLPRAPLHLFDANIFYPERYTLAYSEPMIVQGIMAMPLLWAGASIVLAYNVVLVAGFALSAWTMTLVVRRWTGDWTAGLVAGSIFAFNAHSLSRIPHLQAQHLEFLPLALYAFDRVLEAPTTRNGLKLAAWFVLQSLTSVYLLVITAFALIASGIARLPDLKRHPLFTLQSLAVGAAASVAVLAPLLLPYWQVSRELGLVRTLDDASGFAATGWSYLSTPARAHVWWSAQFSEGGNVLFPGALGLLLTAVAIARGDALRDRRARMCLAVGIAGVALSFGANLPGYSVLYAVMPLLHGIRATARFGVLATCAVAVLSGFGVVALRRAVPARAWSPLAVVLVLLASFESLAAPLGLTRFEAVPPVYADVPRSTNTVVLEVPFYNSRNAQFHAQYMLYSTSHWDRLVNGYSGFQPPSFYENAQALGGFPDEKSFARLRALGVTHLFVHSEQLPEGTLSTLDARPDLQRTAAFGSIVLYKLK